MMNDEIRITADRVPWNYDVAIRIGAVDRMRHKIAHAKTVVFEDVPDGTMFAEPTLRIGETAAQSLMDQLWTCGIRPTEGHGSAGALSATQRHLEDMRQLVFKAHGIGKP
jgi:hypothetical protein